VGLFQADAYSDYGKLYAADRKPGRILEAACWSHARRPFFVYADVEEARAIGLRRSLNDGRLTQSQFVDWGGRDSTSEDAQLFVSRVGGPLGWFKLLKKQRVVILAEAGSGTSDKLAAQATAVRDAGKFAFYATVQDVAHDGLAATLVPADRASLTAWRGSEEPGWFFIDSVDEAKLDGIR